MSLAAHRSLAKYVLAAFSGVWLYAAILPCVLAGTMPQCDRCPPMHSAADADIERCAPATQTDCSLPDLQPVSFDWFATAKIAPPLLATLPISGASDIAPRRHTENAARRAPPPLALRPAVLLI